MGEIFKKLSLPSVIGWLLAGMLVGPHVLNIITYDVLKEDFYKIVINYSQIFVGIIIGSNLVFSKLKKSGSKLMMLSASEIIITFLTVLGTFTILYKVIHFPVFLAVVIASIAIIISTAPVNQVIADFKVDGYLGRTVMPILSLNNLISLVVFFTLMSLIQQKIPGNTTPLGLALFFKLAMPIIFAFIIGAVIVKIIGREADLKTARIGFWVGVVATLVTCLIIDRVVFHNTIVNFILAGCGFSMAFSNLLSFESQSALFKSLAKAKTFGLFLIFVNNSVPVDITKIFSAGGYALLYIIARAVGKLLGSFVGGKLSHSPKQVTDYMGFAILPHAGFSLIFTGVAMGVLTPLYPEMANMLMLTVPAAAMVNEFISIMLSKKAYEWSKEIGMLGKFVDAREIPKDEFKLIERVDEEERKNKICYFTYENGSYEEVCQ